jgi:integrase
MRFYLKQRGSVWQIQWTDSDGTPRRQSTGTADREEAELALARHRVAFEDVKGARLAHTQLEAVLLRYHLNHGRKLFAPGLVELVTRHVANKIPCVTLEQFTLARQEAFIDALAVSPSSARRYLGVIRAACEWSFRRGEIERVPAFLTVQCEDGPGARPYSVDELRRILAACRAPHERRLFLLLIATGARPQAVLQLTWDRIGDGIADFHVPGRRKTKKRRARAPLPAAVAAYLEEFRSVGPVVQWSGRALKKHRMTVDRVLDRAGVVGTAYGTRKALATWLRQRNVPEWEVGALLGHRVTSATTERYAHYRPDYMLATRAALDALMGQIAPDWLAIPYPACGAADPSAGQIPKVANGLDGSREWDRTTDHLHVKEAVDATFQRLKAANDD